MRASLQFLICYDLFKTPFPVFRVPCEKTDVFFVFSVPIPWDSKRAGMSLSQSGYDNLWFSAQSRSETDLQRHGHPRSISSDLSADKPGPIRAFGYQLHHRHDGQRHQSKKRRKRSQSTHQLSQYIQKNRLQSSFSSLLVDHDSKRKHQPI